MRLAFGRALAALTLSCAAALPARADTTTFALTPTWQKVASAGSSVDVQNDSSTGYVVLSTGVAGPPTGNAGQALGPGEHRLYSLAADLYALGTAPVVVTTGFGGSSGGCVYNSTLPTLASGQQTVVNCDSSGRLLFNSGSLGTSVAQPVHAQISDIAGDLTSQNPLPVAQPDVTSSGSIPAATANATYAVALANGEGVVGFRVSGLTASGATLAAEASNDGGATWSAVNTVAPATNALATSVTADGQFRINAGGHTNIRLRVSVAGTGSVAVAAVASTQNPLVAASAPFPVQASPGTIVQTETPVPAATSTPVTVLSARRFLRVTNDGTSSCRVSYGVPATASNGEPLGPAGSASGQGGALTFDASFVPQQALYAYCSAASSFAVVEGQ